MQILDQYGRPFDEAAMSKPQTGMMAAIPSTWGGAPVDGLTPAKLLRILKAAKGGDIAQQSALFSEMEERDPAILGDITKRKNMIASREMSITTRETPPANVSRCADWCKEYIEYLDLSDKLMDAAEGVGHGFQCFEFEGWGAVNGVRAPLGLVPKPHTYFRLRVQDGTVNSAWRMDRTDLRLLDGSAYGAELQPFGWWVHVHRSLSGGLHRAGLFRVLAWLFLYKHFALRDFAEFLEIYGIPPRIGKFDPNNITQRDKNVLYQALQALGHDAAGIVPNTMQIELLQAAGGQTDAHERLYRIANEEFSKAITGKDPQTKGGLGGSGQMEVNNEQVRHDINVGDCRQIANSFTNDVIWPIAALRFGITDFRDCPRLSFNTQEGTDREAFARSVKAMTDAGIPVTKKWAIEQAQVPEAKDGEELLSAPAAAPAPQPNNTTTALPGQPSPKTADSGTSGPASKDAPAGSGDSDGQPMTDGAASLAALLRVSLAHAAATDPAVNRDGLDDATDALLDGWTPVMTDLLAPIRTLLRDAALSGESLESVQARLHTVMGEMDQTALGELIAKGQFVANLAGRAGLLTPNA